MPRAGCVLQANRADRDLQRPDGLVRIILKKAYRDGTVAVDMDPIVATVPIGYQRASTALPHRTLRGGSGSREPVETAHRAAFAHGGVAPGTRRA